MYFIFLILFSLTSQVTFTLFSINSLSSPPGYLPSLSPPYKSSNKGLSDHQTTPIKSLVSWVGDEWVWDWMGFATTVVAMSSSRRAWTVMGVGRCLIRKKIRVHTCLECNENGLIRCLDCSSWKTWKKLDLELHCCWKINVKKKKEKKKRIDLFWIQSLVTGLMVVVGWVWIVNCELWIDTKINILFK